MYIDKVVNRRYICKLANEILTVMAATCNITKLTSEMVEGLQFFIFTYKIFAYVNCTLKKILVCNCSAKKNESTDQHVLVISVNQVMVCLVGMIGMVVCKTCSNYISQFIYYKIILYQIFLKTKKQKQF